MNNKIKSDRLFLLAAVLLCMSFMIAPKKTIKIWLIGDSTMCYYAPERAPLTGWGMPFAAFFNSDVVIDNRARGGRSTRTFIGENRWQPIADSLQKGDYVFMQFGHNDEVKEEKFKDRYTSPEDYKKNLLKFITETKTKKANPILVTPVTRMRFNSEGKAMETHAEYSAIVHEIGAEQNVPVVDLDQQSLDLLQQLGPDSAKTLYMQLLPGEHPNYPEGSKDNTHFNQRGAQKMAELVVAEIKRLHLKLVKHMIKNS